MYWSGTFRFTDPNLPKYTKGKIKFELDIGAVNK